MDPSGSEERDVASNRPRSDYSINQQITRTKEMKAGRKRKEGRKEADETRGQTIQDDLSSLQERDESDELDPLM